jgi:hypothetical protein
MLVYDIVLEKTESYKMSNMNTAPKLPRASELMKRFLGGTAAVGSVEQVVPNGTTVTNLEQDPRNRISKGQRRQLDGPIMSGISRPGIKPGLMGVVGAGEKDGGVLVAIVGDYVTEGPKSGKLKTVYAVELPLGTHAARDGETTFGKLLATIDVDALSRPDPATNRVPGSAVAVLGRSHMGGDPTISGEQFSILVDHSGQVTVADGGLDPANGRPTRAALNPTLLITSQETRVPSPEVTGLYNTLAASRLMWDPQLASAEGHMRYIDPNPQGQR